MLNFFKAKPERIRLTDFIYSHIARARKGKAYKMAFRNICNHIKSFEAKTNLILYTDNFTDAIAEEFIYYLRSEGRARRTARPSERYDIRCIVSDRCGG